MRRELKPLVLALALTTVGAGAAEANEGTLRGSRSQMELQNRVAKEHRLEFHGTPAEIREAVAAGALVELPGNEDYEVAEFVRYRYAHPSVKLFVERLSAQYRETCGQKLVVTSLVRPRSGQPRNAHELSVHPAGMAVDLRVSDRAECRSWLESALLGMERRGVINAIREYNPPHYHVAIYPGPYTAYAAERDAESAEVVAQRADTGGDDADGVSVVAADAKGSGAALRIAGVAAVLLVAAAPFGRRLAGGRAVRVAGRLPSAVVAFVRRLVARLSARIGTPAR